MQLSEVFVRLGDDSFRQLLRRVSLGKLRTYQLFDRMKARAHLAKLNAESLRKAEPRLWTRLQGGDEEFAADIAQAVLVSHLDLVRAVLDFLAIPNEDGFFAKDLDAATYLTDGWQQRVWERFREAHPPAALLFYINHLGWELKTGAEFFQAPA